MGKRLLAVFLAFLLAFQSPLTCLGTNAEEGNEQEINNSLTEMVDEDGINNQEGIITQSGILEEKETDSGILVEDKIEVQFEISSQWDNQYKAEITITNVSNTTIKNWMIQLKTNDEYSQIWNAVIEVHDNDTYIIKNAGYNSNIKAGESVTFGVIGQYNKELTYTDEFMLLGALKEIQDNDFIITPIIQSQWDSGCILELIIENISENDIEEWQLSFDYDAKISSLWNGQLEQDAENAYTVYCEEYNSVIPSGEGIMIGMSLEWDDIESYPQEYVLKDNSYTIDIFEQGELITELSHNSFNYYFDYNENGNMTETSVNKRNLFSAQFIDNQISEMKYGNGEVISYEYLDDRIIACWHNGAKIYSFVYDEAGELSEIKDYDNDLNYNYTYIENVEGITEQCNLSDGFSILSKEREDSNSVIYRNGTIEKEYIEYNTESETESKCALFDGCISTQQVSDNYAQLIIQKDGTEIISKKQEFKDNQINTLYYSDGTSYEYKYKDGNIIEVLENGRTLCTYVYDQEDRLIRENNVLQNITRTYVYDNGNNIAVVNEYLFCEKENLNDEDILNQSTYFYEDDWKDLLTEYNGEKIIYDEIGNPVLYRNGMEMEWTYGRKLSSVKYDNQKIIYSYDYDGKRISKEVNGEITKFRYDNDKLVCQEDSKHQIWYMYDMNSNLVGFILDGISYYYKKNVFDDVVGILDGEGKTIATYSYDAWGNIISVEGNQLIAEINPYRYRSYYYDNETKFYYLLNRFYDAETKRMINADQYISINYPNLYSYALNNPIKNVDPSGNAIETIVDIASAAWSFVDLVTKPSWLNLGFLAWDVVSVCVSFAPGSYVVKGGKKLLKVGSKISDFKTAKYLTIGTYSKVKKLFKGTKNVEVHHLIEKRFLNIRRGGKKVFRNVTAGKMMAVPMSKGLHRTITNRWRKQFTYGMNYNRITKAQMRNAINNVYKDMPALRKYALKYLDEVWKE